MKTTTMATAATMAVTLILLSTARAANVTMVRMPGSQVVVDQTVVVPKSGGVAPAIPFDVVQGDRVTVVLTGEMMQIFENLALPNAPWGTFKYASGGVCHITPVAPYTPCCTIVNVDGFEAPKTAKLMLCVEDGVHQGGKVHVKVVIERRTIMSRMPEMVPPEFFETIMVPAREERR